MSLLLDLILSKNPPTNVLVIESSACPKCNYFCARDVSQMLLKNYQEVVNIRLNPSAHLIESNTNGVFKYLHKFGEEYLRLALAQFCVNELYSNIEALRWASSIVTSRKNLVDSIKIAFASDNGAKMLNCLNTQQGQQFAYKHFQEYRKNAVAGMLPFVFLDGKRERYVWEGLFLDSICRKRSDKAELQACAGVKAESAAAPLDDLCYDNINVEKVEEIQNKAFDFQKFWSTPDDDKNEETHLKFIAADDE